MQDHDQALTNLLWLLPTAIGTFGVKFLRDLAMSVARLNETIAVVVARIDTHEGKLEDHEDRIRGMEAN